ncbi:hypothetical protein DM01DRAFT_1343545 [Hesseltinella vesiculosa]|uniref:Oxidoreductase AflY n=1 Tax=Hesseltinella vesiculosa TaxID=101127 RepID=A0A1X2GRU6_9FUNG|nr:hypothetical protein DM01DRAFT_1343545 [Hesseltinella vesiculosa]
MSSFLPRVPLSPSLSNFVVPGLTKKANAAVDRLLTQNHQNHHIFFNDIKFTNHLAHHVLVAYALGADECKLEEIYDQHAAYQRPLPPTFDQPVTNDNFEDHLNERDAYTWYLEHFTKEIEKHGSIHTIRRWVWSGNMLAHLVGGAFHPLNHIGYGIEFSLPGMVAQGLAMAACASNSMEHHIPRGIRIHDKQVDPLPTQDVAERNGQDHNSSIPAGQGILIEILDNIRIDPAFDDLDLSQTRLNNIRHLAANETAMDALLGHWQQWQERRPWATRDDIHARLGELFCTCAMAYGASGFNQVVDPSDLPQLDFFFLHGLTSSYFVHILVPHLNTEEAASLMQTHFLMFLGQFVAAGRPTVHVDRLLNYKSPRYSHSTSPLSQDWTVLFKDVLEMEDDSHLAKGIRSLAFGQLVYGQDQNGFGDAYYKAAQATLDLKGRFRF